MKNLFSLLISFTIINLSFAQENTSLDSVQVSIDWEDDTNKNHKYKNIYSQKDEDYIKWIYTISRNVNGYTADKSNEKKYYHDGRGNNPIVFTVEENNEIRFETYRNAVKPSRNKTSNFSINIPDYKMPRIEGSLPKGVMTYFSDSSKGIEMGIEIDNKSRKVKIEILDMAKNLVHIIEDNTLESGWNHYKWDISDVTPDDYILKYTVDGSEMTQIIDIEKFKGSLINRFFDWLF